MFKSAASVSSLAYNFLLSFLLLFAYNGIFLQKLYAVTGSGWDFVSVNLIVFLFLFAACNLLLWPKTAKPLAAFFLMANAVCLYFMADYHIAIDKIMLLNALETDSAEAADLFNKKFFAFLLIGGVLPAVFFCRLKIRFAPLRREFLLRLGLTAAGLAVAAAVIFPNYKYAAQFLRNNRSLKYQLLPVNYVGAVIPADKKNPLSAGETAASIALGIELGGYRFDKYFTKKPADSYPKLEKVEFLSETQIDDKEFAANRALANAVRYARDLCNEPANNLTPEIYAADIKRLDYLGIDVTVLDEAKLHDLGMDMLLSVAQGSVNSPRVAVLQWKGRKDAKEFDLGLVGKGVTFDSGGISLKPAANMGDMKGDMTGSAVVVAAIKAAALQKLPVNVVGVVGLVENMPSGSATRPGDIVRSMSGQTVEIVNTDAEGRLVLGDCLWYIQEKFGVKKIIDVATLTGSTMMTFGFEYAGLFANDDKLAAELTACGETSGEKLWRLPINAEYDKLMDSDIADMKNTGPRLAGGITAACFLQRFIKEGVKWAHLDIAGVDKDDKGHPLTPKGATGFGVRVLNCLLRKTK